MLFYIILFVCGELIDNRRSYIETEIKRSLQSFFENTKTLKMSCMRFIKDYFLCKAGADDK